MSSDRRAALADVIDQAAVLLGAAPEEDAPFAEGFVDNAGLRGEVGSVADDAPGTLFELAHAVRSGRKRSIRSLIDGCRALLLLARDLDAPVGLDPTTAGAVALHLAGAGPFDRRAVVKGHTVRATDADWGFGHGPVLEGTSTAIAAFLLGTTDEPPKPPVVTDGE